LFFTPVSHPLIKSLFPFGLGHQSVWGNSLSLASKTEMVFSKNTVHFKGQWYAETEEFIDGWLLTVIEVLNFFGQSDLCGPKGFWWVEVVARGLSSEDM
jgi:hypothetical protein